jgi:hypothetical protein
MQTLYLTQANDEGFDAQALGFDIKHLTNVKVFCVAKSEVVEQEGHLNCVRVTFYEGELADPASDPMIVGTIKRSVDGKPDSQWRVIWDDKLWRPLDDNGAAILEAFYGIKAKDVEQFAAKLADQNARQSMLEGLILKHGGTFGP